MSKINDRFKRRLAIVCMAVLGAMMAVIHATVYFTGRRDMEAQLQETAKGIAVSVANCIALDEGAYRGFLQSMDAGSDYYRRMQAYLASIKQGSCVKYLYTERKVDERTAEFVMDGEPSDSPAYSPPGTVDAPDDASHGEAVAHKETVYSTAVPRGFRSLRFNKRGELLGAHAPIVGGDGELLGLVGVEIDGSSLYGHLRRLNRTLLLTYALILALALASVLEFSNAVIDRLFKDKLTGAYTKRYFDGLLHDEVARCARHGQGLALLMLDLDHYKSLNDEHGHAFGDRVLAAASEAMWRSVRPSDYLVRYGGDEFAIIMADAGAGAALAAAERIRRAVEETRVFDDERVEQVGVTISIGVAELGHLAQGAQDLVKNADRALYHAKAARNAVMVFQ